MPFIEQNAVIEAPLNIVMQALNDVESIPLWATVTGTIDNIQGSGVGTTYEWHYTFNKLSFNGKSEVLEQTEDTLITKTTEGINSIWIINLTAVGKQSTSINVLVEYSPPNIFIEILADLVQEQLNDPLIARENMARFKTMVEKRAKIAMEQTAVTAS